MWEAEDDLLLLSVCVGVEPPPLPCHSHHAFTFYPISLTNKQSNQTRLKIPSGWLHLLASRCTARMACVTDRSLTRSQWMIRMLYMTVSWMHCNLIAVLIQEKGLQCVWLPKVSDRPGMSWLAKRGALCDTRIAAITSQVLFLCQSQVIQLVQFHHLTLNT